MVYSTEQNAFMIEIRFRCLFDAEVLVSRTVAQKLN
jgi:hypothetical protein